MKNTRISTLSVVCCMLCLVMSGCAQKSPSIDLNVDSQPVSPQLISWYHFTPSSFKGYTSVESPQKATRVHHKPWTEAVRISAAAEIAGEPLFLVNRLGMMTFAPEPRIYADAFLFSNATAESIVCIENNPVFHLYKSSFFNENPDGDVPFLVHFRFDSKEFFPILSTKDLGLNADAQAVDLFFSGDKWVSAFKTIQNEKVLFNYLTFTSNESLLLMKEQTRASAIENTPITAQEYQAYMSPQLMSAAPTRLKNLLQAIPNSASYQVSCLLYDGVSPVYFMQNGSDNSDIFEAHAFLGKEYAIAVFADGTAFFSGSLPGSPIVRDGLPMAFRLPKLGEGFIYGNFILADTTLYVAWEETAFFETGRSGFLTIQMENVVY